MSPTYYFFFPFSCGLGSPQWIPQQKSQGLEKKKLETLISPTNMSYLGADVSVWLKLRLIPLLADGTLPSKKAGPSPRILLAGREKLWLSAAQPYSTQL